MVDKYLLFIIYLILSIIFNIICLFLLYKKDHKPKLYDLMSNEDKIIIKKLMQKLSQNKDFRQLQELQKKYNK